MKKSTAFTLAVGLLLLAVAVVMLPKRLPPARLAPKPAEATPKKTAPPAAAAQPPVALNRPPPPEPVAPGTLSAAEKSARIEKIKRDYDEIRAKASTDYSAAGANFPGGLNAFLRQLALLEREKRADFGAVLSPRELEDLEMRETSAGQLVQRLLGATSATEDQRRAAFRLQRDFEDRFALTFDVTPAALLERETARQQTQEKIRGALGDELFAAWLRGEGEDYAGFVAFAALQNLPATAPLELWRAKNEFTVRRLELAANRGLSPEQRNTAQKMMVQQTEMRVLNVVGTGAWQAARTDVLRWLPKG